MTPEQINETCAKLDGWKPEVFTKTQDGAVFEMSNWKVTLPSYTTSYDAIIPLVQKQSAESKRRMDEICGLPNRIAAFDVTPLDLCITLLKEKGLYE